MKRRYLLPVLVLILLAIGMATRAFAILGLGDIVFDPSNYAEAIQQLAQMEQQYFELVQSYQMLQNQYNQMMRMAQQVPVSMTSRYRAPVTPWQGSSASNTYGTTAGWIAAINSGQDVSASYAETTEALGTYGSALSNIPTDQLARIQRDYGTVELTDGANQSGMGVIGLLRTNSTTVESAIQNLENDSLSSDPAMNTEVGVLNKINAANLVNVRNTQDTNKLLVALAEGEMVEAKRVRDAEARAINNHIHFMSEAQAAMAAQAADASQAMLNWQMP